MSKLKLFPLLSDPIKLTQKLRWCLKSLTLKSLKYRKSFSPKSQACHILRWLCREVVSAKKIKNIIKTFKSQFISNYIDCPFAWWNCSKINQRCRWLGVNSCTRDESVINSSEEKEHVEPKVDVIKQQVTVWTIKCDK